MDGAGGSRQGESIFFIGNRKFGKAAIVGIAGEPGIVAEIFPAFKAVAAAAAGVTQPGNSDAVPGVEFCHPGADELKQCQLFHVPESKEV